MNAIPRLKAHHGPALLSYGFRPFFFFGACYAALATAVWLPMFKGDIGFATLFAPRDWHAHEMLFGYLAAVVTGFLLTAIPNWTGRLPLQGTPLLALVLVWVAGRFAVASSAHLGWLLSASIDCAFLVIVVAAAAREIIAGQNWRNLKVLIPVSVLALANVGVHIEAYVYGIAEFSMRSAIAAIATLIMVIGGRIVPSFTRNWLVRENPGRLPTPFARFDAVSIAWSALALVMWVVMPDVAWTAAALLVAAALQCARLVRWAGDRTARDRLVLVLHIAYAFIPLGFGLAGLGALGVTPSSAEMHAWMVGAAGTMTLAVMTRATLGHTGRELAANAGTQAIYAFVVIAACARVAATVFPNGTAALLHIAALAWVSAFGGFAFLYGPMLFRRKVS